MSSMRLILVCTSAVIAGCASSPQVDPVAQTLGSHDQQLSDLRKEVSQLRALVEGISAAGLGTSLVSIEEDMRNLRGQVEALEYELRDMQQRRRTVIGSGERQVPPPQPSQAPSATATDPDDQKAYLSAFSKLKSGNYEAAIQSFGSFLQNFPQSAYAPNAQYWIGEAYYVQRNFESAWAAFDKVSQNFPQSLKAADARLKQGLIRVDQGRMGEARKILQQVASEHAGSSAGRLAAERLQRMGGG
nr:tol-pal system protein YbgF [Oceanococcus sp. HetDA_MAG_MS8]